MKHGSDVGMVEHSALCVGMCTSATGVVTWPHAQAVREAEAKMSGSRVNGRSQLSSWISPGG